MLRGQPFSERGEPVGAHLCELLALERCQSESASAGDDQVEYGPAQTQAAGLARETPDHLDPSTDLTERALQQVGGAQPLAQPERVVEVDGERRQVLGQAGGRARELAL